MLCQNMTTRWSQSSVLHGPVIHDLDFLNINFDENWDIVIVQVHFKGNVFSVVASFKN